MPIVYNNASNSSGSDACGALVRFCLWVYEIPVQRCMWFNDVPRASTPIRVMLMFKRWTYYKSHSHKQTYNKHLFDSMTNLIHAHIWINRYTSKYNTNLNMCTLWCTRTLEYNQNAYHSPCLKLLMCATYKQNTGGLTSAHDVNVWVVCPVCSSSIWSCIMWICISFDMIGCQWMLREKREVCRKSYVVIFAI